MTEPASPPTQQESAALGWTSFLVPLFVSLGANTVWGLLSGSLVLLVAGLVTPLLLMLAVERWRALPVLTGWLRAAQVTGMALVVIVAAAWSWVHTTGLLLAQFKATTWLEVALCVVAPLAVDGLAVLSVLGLNRDQTPAADEVAEPEPVIETVAAPEPWGPPETVTDKAAEDEPAAQEPVAAPPKLRSVTGKRTRTQLVAAGAALTPAVRRGGNEKIDDFRERVEAAERAARRDRQAVTA